MRGNRNDSSRGRNRSNTPKPGNRDGRKPSSPRSSDAREDRNDRGPKKFSSKPGDRDGRKPSAPRSNDAREERNERGPKKFSPKPQFKSVGEGARPAAHAGFYKKKYRKPTGKSAEDLAPASDNMRLNRYIAISGIASRREADELIRMGLVTVNGKQVVEMGYKVKRYDEVRYQGTLVRAEQKVYILMNKPKGYLTTMEDPKARKTVMDILGGKVKERIYPVGRLDRSTTGVLMLTNDGDLAKKLTHATDGARKIYAVALDKSLSKGDLDMIAKGIELEDGVADVAAINYIADKSKSNIGMEITSGKNQVIRRIFKQLGYEVTKLDRASFAGLTKKNLSRGQWRYLTDKEINFLRML